MTIVNSEGCIIHKRVQWDRLEEGHDIFKCLDCDKDVEREASDCGSGC